MTETNYKIVFSLTVSHSYFENNICRSLSFIPDPASEKWMKRFGFLTRKKVNGFDLFVNSNQPLVAYLDYIKTSVGRKSFDFLILNSDSTFVSFTDLPIDWVGQLIYDSSNNLSVIQQSTIELKPELTFERGASAFGKISFQFKDILADQSKKTTANFTINFESRSTQWQYYVINKSLLDLNESAVVSKSGMAFTRMEEKTIQTGEQALLFSSNDQLIPLSEKPKFKFDLVINPEKRNGNLSNQFSISRTVFKGLPNPDPSRINVVQVNGKNQVASPMYIYV